MGEEKGPAGTAWEEKNDNNESENDFHEINIGQNSKHKHGIAQILYEAQTPTKKKRKERESVEHSIVKENQSLSLMSFDHTKRKIKKMVEMVDFLERERNISLLNEICRSKSGMFRKKCKRNLTSSGRSSNCKALTEPLSGKPIETKDSGIDSPTISCSTQLQTNTQACNNIETRQDVSEFNTFSNSQKGFSNIFPAINDHSKSDDMKGHISITYDYSSDFKPFTSYPSLSKSEVEIESGVNPMNEADDDCCIVGLQMSDLKENSWIDPDGYTSDESVLVIDEGVDDVDEGGNHGSRNVGRKPCLKGISDELPVEKAFQQLESRSEINVENNLSKSDATTGSTTVDSPYVNNYSPIQRKLFSNGKKDTPIEKIKILNMNETDDKHDSNEQSCSLSLIKMTEMNNSNQPPAEVRFIEGGLIDVENNGVKTENFEDKHSLRNENPASDSQDMIGDSPRQTLSASNLDSVIPSKEDYASSTKHCSSYHQNSEPMEREFNVLRTHLERGNCSQEKFRISKDLSTSRFSTNRSEYFSCQVDSKNISNDNHISEPTPRIHLSQNTFIEFNKVIFCMYRELLTPHSQNLIRQLTEVLHLVITESIRYSDRCKKSKRLMSAELMIREQVLAHRDFQANTTFYGMYFTHLFRNVVQCFPVTKEYHNFMYLALFVNISRRLRTVFNVSSSYVHIARKLVVSMLKANSYHDFTVFLAICKPDYVFETDYILVSQLIDSFYDFAKAHSSQTIGCLVQGFRHAYEIHQANAPTFIDRNTVHTEFHTAQKSVAFKSLSYSDPCETNLIKEDSHLFGNQRFSARDIDTARDQREFIHSFEPNKENSVKSRPFSLESETQNPVTPTSLSPSTPMNSPTAISYSTPSASSPTATSFHTSTSLGHHRNRNTERNAEANKMLTPRGFSRSAGMPYSTHFLMKLGGLSPRQSSSVHLWRPTAVRPSVKPCSYFHPTPFFLNSFTISPPTSSP